MSSQGNAVGSGDATSELVNRGWRIAYIGWVAPIVPVIGFVGLIVLSVVAILHGVLAATKGNTSAGLRLILAAWLGSTAVGLLWMSLYALLASIF